MTVKRYIARGAVVLGGGGFIGSALRRRLALDGVPVTVLSRSPAKVPASPNERWIIANLADTAALEQALEPDVDIYHLISDSIPAKGNWDIEQDILRSVLPTLALLKAAVQNNARRLIFVSSGGTVYGTPSALPIREDAPTNPISAYGVAKLTLEKYLLLFNRHHGLDCRILRVANPYGPGQVANRQQGVVANLLHQALTGTPFQIWGDGSVARDFVHVDDVAESLQLVADYIGEERIFNVGSGKAITIAQIADDIAATLKIPDHPRIHHQTRSFDVPINYLDISLIQGAIGWSPRIEWHEGLRQTAGWMRSSQQEHFC